MNSSNIIVAAAGSGKTKSIIDEALANKGKRILITTYTNENLASIRSRIIRSIGLIPEEITILSWFKFLLRDGARPYQNHVGLFPRIEGINFHSDRMSRARRYLSKSDLKYYVDGANCLYRDELSDFVCECDLRSKGLVIQRIASVYDIVLIDELQDLSAYDLDFLELLIESCRHVIMVGDPRQSTYKTSRSQRNKQYRGSRIVNWINEVSRTKGVKVVTKSECYRCNKEICDFADGLYPSMEGTVSNNSLRTGHDGIFSVSRSGVKEYYHKYRPAVLRYDRRTDTCGYDALNFGAAKGRDFDRVLIFPTRHISSCLRKGDFSGLEEVTRSKLYVAVTRARYSVAFVTDEK